MTDRQSRAMNRAVRRPAFNYAAMGEAIRKQIALRWPSGMSLLRADAP
jgi:hypothetical protein